MAFNLCRKSGNPGLNFNQFFPCLVFQRTFLIQLSLDFLLILFQLAALPVTAPELFFHSLRTLVIVCVIHVCTVDLLFQ